jgi:hypothetical protein
MAMEQALTIVRGDVVPPDERQAIVQFIDLIRRNLAPKATDIEFELWIEECKFRALNPLARHIYLIPYGNKHVTQVSIDGLRLIAARTGEYAGCDAYEYDTESEKNPNKATCTVYRLIQGQRMAFTASVFWAERNKGRDNWVSQPYHMLGKCFSEDTEVLTDRGFQRFADVSGRVLMVTEWGLAATDAKPFVQPYAGDMVTLDSDDLNFSVTPNHDMVTMAGKMEARDLYERARSRPQDWIPRIVKGGLLDAPVTSESIVLSAVYLADGTDRPGRTFAVAVSRPHKIEHLRAVGGYVSANDSHTAGQQAVTPSRTITTRADKVRFAYPKSAVSFLCDEGKRVKMDALLRLSKRQARLFVDTLIAYDGHTVRETKVRRFYTSRIDHMEAFELAAVIAGYSVSQRKTRYSDIGTKPNYIVTITERDEIPVVRWGRAYHAKDPGNPRNYRSLSITQNAIGRVWCVTVPSGVIVVRRNGFSMLCGNCAESAALRKAFPEECGGLYSDDEMGEAYAAAPEREVRAAGKPVQVARPPSGGSSRQALRASVQRQPATEEPPLDAESVYGVDAEGNTPPFSPATAALLDELNDLAGRGFLLEEYLRKVHPNRTVDELTDEQLTAAVERGRGAARRPAGGNAGR